MARLEVAPKLWQKGTCSCLDAPLGITGCEWCTARDNAELPKGAYEPLLPCVGGLIRKDFREVTNIEGGYMGDCLCHCGPLHFFSLCQELNELKLRTGDTDSKNYGIKQGVKYDVEAIKASIAQQGGGGGGQAPPQQQQQQGGYPPQQGGYPPQQGGYPPQQGGYPPQQGGYPPQQQQQMSYPQQY